jgi:hypothetical protein
MFYTIFKDGFTIGVGSSSSSESSERDVWPWLSFLLQRSLYNDLSHRIVCFRQRDTNAHGFPASTSFKATLAKFVKDSRRSLVLKTMMDENRLNYCILSYIIVCQDCLLPAISESFMLQVKYHVENKLMFMFRKVWNTCDTVNSNTVSRYGVPSEVRFMNWISESTLFRCGAPRPVVPVSRELLSVGTHKGD